MWIMWSTRKECRRDGNQCVLILGIVSWRVGMGGLQQRVGTHSKTRWIKEDIPAVWGLGGMKAELEASIAECAQLLAFQGHQ
jgi:hypothetical protein